MKVKYMCLCLLCVFLFSCTSSKDLSTGHKEYSNQDVLPLIQKAVQNNLLPKFSESSFLNEPTLIIAGETSGTANITGKISKLTKKIRRAITVQLLKKSGIYLVQRHRLRRPEEPGIKPRLECDNYTQPKNYLIIDTNLGQQNVYVNLLAMFVGENRPVPGSSISFSFKKTKQMEDLHQKIQWDEYLEGTKHYPIQENDQDAAAGYLGYSLVCLLKNTYLPDSFSLFVETSGTSGYEYSILEFLKNYLNMYGVPIASKKVKATHILKHSSGQTGNCRVLWVRVLDKKNGHALPGSSTRVYYQKDTPPLSMELKQNNYGYYIRLHSVCNLQSKIKDFTIRDNGSLIFPNEYCLGHNLYYKIKNGEAILNFKDKNTIFVGGPDTGFLLYVVDSGKLYGQYTYNGKRYNLTYNY